MKLSSADIPHQEFKRRFRGLDPHEVRAFLEVVADAYEELERHNHNLLSQIRQLETDKEKLHRDIGAIELTVREQKAELAKIEKLMESRADADSIVRQAEAEAARLVSDARAKSEGLKKELTVLQDMKSKVAAHLREYLRSQIALVDIVDDDARETTEDVVPDTLADVGLSTAVQPADATPAAESIDSLQSGIQTFLSGIKLDDLPPELVEEISIDAALGTSPEGEKMTDEERRRKILNDLESLSQHATAMFKKSDFHKMLGEDAEKKSEEIINRIYAELEKKKNQTPPEKP